MHLQEFLKLKETMEIEDYIRLLKIIDPKGTLDVVLYPCPELDMEIEGFETTKLEPDKHVLELIESLEIEDIECLAKADYYRLSKNETVNNYNTMARYLTILHGDSKGWITLASVKDGVIDTQLGIKYNQLAMVKHSFMPTGGLLISTNTFKRDNKRTDCLQELKALFVDLNVYNTSYSKEEVLDLLENKYIGYKIPLPTFIIDTGKGLRIEILIDTESADKLEKWKAVQSCLYSILKPLGAVIKSTGYTGLNSIPGCKYNKTWEEARVKILRENLIRYNLEDIYIKYVSKGLAVINNITQLKTKEG